MKEKRLTGRSAILEKFRQSWPVTHVTRHYFDICGSICSPSYWALDAGLISVLTGETIPISDLSTPYVVVWFDSFPQANFGGKVLFSISIKGIFVIQQINAVCLK